MTDVEKPPLGMSQNQYLFFMTVAYLGLNLGLNFFNKEVLGQHTGLQFTFPLFYTFCHQMASLIFVSVIFYVWPSTNTLNYQTFREKWRWLVVLGIMFVANITCNNASLVFVALSINAIGKSTVPLPTIAISAVLEKKKYDAKVITAVVVMTTTACLAVPYGDNVNAQPIGLIMVLVSVLCTATRPPMAVLLMGDAKQSGLSPLVLVWYDSLISSALLFVLSAVFEGHRLMGYFADRPFEASYIIVIGSTMAFCYNLITFNLTKVLGSVAVSVLGNAKQVLLPRALWEETSPPQASAAQLPCCVVLSSFRSMCLQVMLIVISAFVVEGLTNTRSVISIIAFSLACGYYTHLVVQEKQAAIKKAELEKMAKEEAMQPPKDSSNLGAKGGAGSYGACTETTPLVTGSGQAMRPQGGTTVASSC